VEIKAEGSVHEVAGSLLMLFGHDDILCTTVPVTKVLQSTLSDLAAHQNVAHFCTSKVIRHAAGH